MQYIEIIIPKRHYNCNFIDKPCNIDLRYANHVMKRLKQKAVFMTGSILYREFYETLKDLKEKQEKAGFFRTLFQGSQTTATIRNAFDSVKQHMLAGPVEPSNLLHLQHKIYLAHAAQHLLVKVRPVSEVSHINYKNVDIHLYDLDAGLDLFIQRHPGQPDFWMSEKKMTAAQTAEHSQRFEHILYSHHGFSPRLG